MLWGEKKGKWKAGSCRKSNPGHLWFEAPVLCHLATTARWPPTLTIVYMYCTGGTECLSCTVTEPQQPDNHQPSQSFIFTVFRVRKPLSMSSFLMERIFWSILDRVLTAHTARWALVTQARGVLSSAPGGEFSSWWLTPISYIFHWHCNCREVVDSIHVDS